MRSAAVTSACVTYWQALMNHRAIVIIADINNEMGKKREAELKSKGYK